MRITSQSDDHQRAAGDGGAVAARLADHRRGFARDRAFIDAGDAFDDFAIGGDEITRLDENDVARRRSGARVGL